MNALVIYTSQTGFTKAMAGNVVGSKWFLGEAFYCQGGNNGTY